MIISLDDYYYYIFRYYYYLSFWIAKPIICFIFLLFFFTHNQNIPKYTTNVGLISVTSCTIFTLDLLYFWNTIIVYRLNKYHCPPLCQYYDKIALRELSISAKSTTEIKLNIILCGKIKRFHLLTLHFLKLYLSALWN